MVASAGWDETAVLWNLNLKTLLAQGCGWLHGYVSHNSNVSDEDRQLCEGIEFQYSAVERLDVSSLSTSSNFNF